MKENGGSNDNSNGRTIYIGGKLRNAIGKYNAERNAGSDSPTNGEGDGSESRSDASASGSNGSEINGGDNAQRISIVSSGSESEVRSDNNAIQPDSGIGGGSGERRKRGRPRGSRNRSIGESGGNNDTGTTGTFDTNAGLLNLSFGEIISEDKPQTGKRGRPRKDALQTATVETIADGLEILFQFPPLVGLGQINETENVWPLSRFESVEFAKALRKCVAQIDDKRFQRIIKAFEKFSPWLGVVMVTHSIVTPRVKISMELLKKQNESTGTEAKTGNDVGNVVGETRSGLFTASDKTFS